METVELTIKLLAKSVVLLLCKAWKGYNRIIARAYKTKMETTKKVISIFAQNGTRTHTPLRELGPEPSASTNSAIWALQKMQQGKYRPKVPMMSIGLRQIESIVYLNYKNLSIMQMKVL